MTKEEKTECGKASSRIDSPSYDENELISLLTGKDEETVCMLLGKPTVEKP